MDGHISKLSYNRDHPDCIKTKRLEIKPYQPRDEGAMIALLTNPTIRKTYMLPALQTAAEQVQFFKGLLADSSSQDHFERGIYLDGQLIGFVNDVMISDDTIELGYVIHPSHHNKGYATEMFKAVIDRQFKSGFSKVVAAAFAQNASSIRVMEKSGMKKSEHEDVVTYNGVEHRCVYYEICSDWELPAESAAMDKPSAGISL